MDKSQSSLARRLAKLKFAIDRSSSGCNCRPHGSTAYHSAAELAAILSIPCPTHGFRDLGDLLWFPVELPLLPEDQELCRCAPSATRAWLQNKRGGLTADEQTQEFRMLEEEFWSEESQNRFANDQVEVARLVRKYEQEMTACRGASDNHYQL